MVAPRNARNRRRQRSRFATTAICLWLATVGPAASAASDDESCPYLRLSLSTPQRIPPADDRELQQEYLAVFALHLERAGFVVAGPSTSRFSWELFSQVEPLGAGRLAWSYALLPMPGLADGMIEFPTFSVIERPGGERVKFTTYHGLEHLRSGDFPLRAALASEKLANLYLPVALELCANRGTSLDLETARLERIRRELTEEIQRISAQRREQTKHLELEPEQGNGAESGADNEPENQDPLLPAVE